MIDPVPRASTTLQIDTSDSVLDDVQSHSTPSYHIEARPFHPFTLFITNAMNADTIVIQTSYLDTIENLKRLIQQKTNVTPSNQIIVFAGEALPSTGRIVDTEIPMQAHLYLLDRENAQPDPAEIEQEQKAIQDLMTPPPPQNQTTDKNNKKKKKK